MSTPTKNPPPPFADVAGVEPARLAEAPAGFDRVQEFLRRFGYLTDDTKVAAEAKITGSLDADTSGALARYQGFHGLVATGLFDEATREMMTRSRCLLPDPPAGSPLAFSTKCAWNRTTLTYAFGTGHR